MNTMQTKVWHASALLLGVLCLFGAGCGVFNSSTTPAAPDFALGGALSALARTGDVYDIFDVVPGQGPLAGGNSAKLRGTFPDPQSPVELAAAVQTYAVYFGNNLAAYDDTMSPVISGGRIYVTVPPGDTPGLVDVIFRDMTTLADAATLYGGYEYLDPYALTGVVPDYGPLAGGQQVKVLGRFPILADFLTIVEAESVYRVYFDGRPAAFDDSFGPVITADAMYVITPPGAVLGLVDVSVATVVPPSESPAFRVLPLGYEYIDMAFQLYSVDPNIGRICGFEPVTLHGAFPVSMAFSQYLLANVSAASYYYDVYFNNSLAQFDFTQPDPVITATEMYILTPPGDNTGLVDVRIVPHVGDDYSNPDVAQLNQAYRYYAMTLVEAVPPLGPLAGGTLVRLEGFLPGFAAIDDIYTAAAAYTVYFGGIRADFADMTPNPVFEPSTIIDIAACIYTTGYMYVIAPPGAAPGFVDVTIVDNRDQDLPTTLVNGYEYLGGFRIDSCDPNIGRICGGEPVTIRGAFPVSNAFSLSLLGNAAAASQYYDVYFGRRLAVFDTSVLTPVITSTEMRVISPYGDDVGPVDITVLAHDGANYSSSEFAELDGAFRYYAMYLSQVIPPSGPLAGGTLVRLEGFLPGLAAITDIYAAEAAYSVYFGGLHASFADMGPAPVFQPSAVIDMASCMYTTGYMYVTAPPGLALGFVDVTIVDDTDKDLPTTAVNGYEYVGTGVSRWTLTQVCPNPVGKLDKGQLLVRIEGQGKLANPGAVPAPVFIVPQGGIPISPGDRIALKELPNGYTETGTGFVWEGTNVAAIPRVMANGLLVDGHAAVYVDNDGDLLGDNVADPTDGGVIQIAAQQGRHFLIDTIPPRLMIVDNGNHAAGFLRGDDFVSSDIPGNWTMADLDTGPFPSPEVRPHPYVAGPLASDRYDAPFDGHEMMRPAGTDSMAQVFFKVSSLTNNFADSLLMPNLQFAVNVTFEDVDIYTMMGKTPGPRDADFFGGSTVRQVAGFATGLNTDVSGLVRDEAFTNGSATLPDLLIQWEFLPTAFRQPDITGIRVQYQAAGPLSLGARLDLSPNLAATPTQMKGMFTLGDPSNAATGVQVDTAGDRNLMSAQFRAVDRAGDNFQLCNGVTPGTKFFTRNDTSTTEGYAANQQPEMGPLNMWWLRSTATRLTSTVPPSGDVIAPGFAWQNTGAPDPGAIGDPFGVTDRRYSYAIYRTDPAQGTRDQQRDGPYTLVGSLNGPNGEGGPGQWSGWVTRTSLAPAEVQQVIASYAGATEGAWFLLVVMSADEAGNFELWPEAQLLVSSNGGPPVITRVDETQGTEERNWARWFVPASGEQVDTRIEPFFWHDDMTDPTVLPAAELVGRPDPGEPSFGDAEVIPLPGPQTFNPPLLLQRVAGRFRITLVATQVGAGLQYEMVQNGVSLGIVDVAPSAIIGNTFTPVFYDGTDTTHYLGAASRKPTYYTFRARTFIDANGNGRLDAGEIYDTSPATVQFVVVDNVAHYIQNRKSEDTQPIQEMDRP